MVVLPCFSHAEALWVSPQEINLGGLHRWQPEEEFSLQLSDPTSHRAGGLDGSSQRPTRQQVPAKAVLVDFQI